MVAHKEVVEFIKEYFRDEPEGTIDTCAREAHACGVPAHKDLIVSVRRDMSDEIKKLRWDRELKKKAPEPIQPMLRLVRPPAPRVTVPVPKEEETAKVPIGVRRSCYDDILLSTPGITITKAMQEVKRIHGLSVDVGYALASLRAVRELYAQQTPTPARQTMSPQPPAAPPKPTKVEEPAQEYAVIYVKTGGGEIHELVKHEALNSKILELISKGVAQSTIKVFKQVKLKLQVSIDLG